MKQLNKSTVGDATHITPLGYTPDDHGIGIVHLGLGAFHRSHQAWYTDKTLAAQGGDWRIAAVSMRSVETAQILAAQDGLYTLNEVDADGSQICMIGSIAKALTLRKQRAEIESLMIASDCRIITLTVTEKAYYYDPALDQLDLTHPDIQQDLKDISDANTVPVFLAYMLQQRMRSGVGGLTVLSCDNLPHNGAVTKRVILSIAQKIDAGLHDWIETNVAFPSSMVDRITPAITDEILANMAERIGLKDDAAIQAETFSQWVIEDNFPYGRPAWDVVGALLVQDVAPYEEMKLRMLNGSHSLLAYAGHLAGKPTIKSCMEDPVLRGLLQRHLKMAASTLTPLEGVDYQDYAAALIARFDNPNVVHQTYQIAMDGSQKMRQRIFTPTHLCLEKGTSFETFAFGAAVWILYCCAQTETGEKYSLNDPREEEISTALADCTNAQDILDRMAGVDGLIPEPLLNDNTWRESVVRLLDATKQNGVIPTAATLLR